MKKEIIAASHWTPGKDGMEFPSRYVVLAWVDTNGKTTEYSRHLQINDGVTKEHFIHGNYCGKVETALDNMKESVRLNNKNYPVGNQSHIPGIYLDANPKDFPVGSKYEGFL